MQRQQQAGNAAVQQSIANLNASTARTAATSNANRAAIDQQGQAARSAARYNSGVQSGNGSSAQWCNTVTNEQRTVYNSLNPPDSSGAWRHCD
jgi:GH35 family endo-1,4-beta-xylanase